MSIIDIIGSNNVNKEKSSNNINKNNKNDKDDIILEMFNKNLLTSERLQFIMKSYIDYFDISSNLIMILMLNRKVTLLDVIFSNLKFYDNEFLMKLLFYYKNKTAISIIYFRFKSTNFNKKFKISLNTNTEENNLHNNVEKYLTNECNKKDINLYVINYLIKRGADINKEDISGKTPLFNACKNGNEAVVKYLVKHGADINKKTSNNKISLVNRLIDFFY